jgi:CRP-like cAMP-binding protein
MLNPDFNILNNSDDNFSKLLLDVIEKIGENKKVKQGTVIVEDKVKTNTFFVIIDGIFKTVKRINEQEHIVCFTFNGDIDGDPLVFMDPPAQYYKLVSVIDSTIILFDWQNLKHEIGEYVFNKMLSHYLLKYIQFLQARVIENIALNSEERYRMLVQQNPQQSLEIPLLDLSAYLGITPQSLSRIRANKV